MGTRLSENQHFANQFMKHIKNIVPVLYKVWQKSLSKWNANVIIYLLLTYHLLNSIANLFPKFANLN